MRFASMPPLPPQLQALAAANTGPLRPVTVRVGTDDLELLEAVRDRLNQPSRGALLRYVVSQGLAAVAAQLDAAERETQP